MSKTCNIKMTETLKYSITIHGAKMCNTKMTETLNYSITIHGAKNQ